VHHFKPNGELVRTIGTAGSAGCRLEKLFEPNGVAVSRLSSSIFISDYSNRISEFNQSDGAFVRVLDTPGLEDPLGMCLSPDETILAIACGCGNCIKLVRVDGSEAPRTIGGERGSGDGQLDSPCDVCYHGDGRHLVVADRHNHRVQVLSTDGTFVRQMTLGAHADAVAVDATGNIIAATEKYVKVFSSEGRRLHDRLGGHVTGGVGIGGVDIDLSTGRIAVGDMRFGKVNLLS
jgi:DNA-binding beta-propeller fold protein YncE